VTDKRGRRASLPDPASLRAEWDRDHRRNLFRSASSKCLIRRPGQQKGGRNGVHGEEMGHLLAELQYMQRAYPGQTW
jgi:ring-1,2-phenylacetyl-CoA epoxidase subunit PaaC